MHNELKKYFFFGLIFSILIISGPLLKFYNLRTNIADLGFFISNITSVNTEWWRAFSGHVQPLMLLYGYILSFVSIDFFPYLLLLTQSIVIIYSAHLVNKYYGFIPCIAFMLYYPVWNNALFDYHFDHLAILIILLFFINFKKNNTLSCLFFAIFLMFIKEVYALQTVACGLFLIISAIINRKLFNCNLNILIGISLLIIGSVYFIISMEIILPYFSQNSTELGVGSPAFNWLGNSYIGIIKNLLLNFFDIIYKIFSNFDKVKYILVIFLPFLFIPILYPTPLIVALPPLMISLLSNLSNYYDYSNHYTAGIVTPLIISFSGAYYILIQRINKKHFSYLIILMLLLSIFALGSTPISRLFWSNKVWSYSYQAYLPNERDKFIIFLINKYIPIDRSIVVSSQNNINNITISNRLVILPYPIGVSNSYSAISINANNYNNFFDLVLKNPTAFPYNYIDLFADYVLIDTKRPHFIVDKGCNWIYGKCLDENIDSKYYDSILNMKRTYIELISYDGFYIYKKID